MKTLKITTLYITLILLVLLTACDTTSPGFTLGVSPASLSLQQGETKTVTVTITPIDNFMGVVSVTLESTVLTAVPLTIAKGTTSGTLTVTAKVDATLGASTAKIKGSSGSLNDSSDLQVTIMPKAFTISGTVINYTAGQASLSARVIEDVTTVSEVGQGTIQTNGSFTLKLGDAPEKSLIDSDQGLGFDCGNVTPTPSFKAAGLSLIYLVKDNNPTGLLFQASSPEFVDDFLSISPRGVTGKMVLWLYADQKAQLKGDCANPDPRYNLPVRLDLSLEKGWNTLMIDITESRITQTTSFTALPWHYVPQQASALAIKFTSVFAR